MRVVMIQYRFKFFKRTLCWWKTIECGHFDNILPKNVRISPYLYPAMQCTMGEKGPVRYIWVLVLSHNNIYGI